MIAFTRIVRTLLWVNLLFFASGWTQTVERPSGLNDQVSISQKYRKVFFPSGMPSSEDPFSGDLVRTLYTFYDEAPLDPFKAVLYSQEIPSNGGHDASFTVHLALLAESAGHWLVSEDLDVTEYMPVQTEFPGNFLKMDGRVNSFSIAKERQAVHVDLWAMLSGTGSLSGASDLIYTLNAANKLQAILILKGTSKYSHIGAEGTQIEDSRLFIGDVDGDGNTELVVERGTSTLQNGQARSTQKAVTMFKYLNGIYQTQSALTSEALAQLHPLALLPRSRLIPTLTITAVASRAKT